MLWEADDCKTTGPVQVVFPTILYLKLPEGYPEDEGGPLLTKFKIIDWPEVKLTVPPTIELV
ncbi:hypothetical protein DBR25_01470 [Chryseobacterium sp. HMWF001]|nr:hypothetical protein DBR25_01470 [Chryseobacterium sp. HMWF001]